MLKSTNITRESTIMFTDIVGYSKMVEKDETHAIKILNEHDQLIETVIRKNNGKIIKHIGDAVFAEFPCTVDAAVFIIIYDLQGRKTAELVNELKTAGYYTLKWDASDHASGIYFVKLMTSEFTKTQKLMLVK